MKKFRVTLDFSTSNGTTFEGIKKYIEDALKYQCDNYQSYHPLSDGLSNLKIDVGMKVSLSEISNIRALEAENLGKKEK